MNALQCDAYTMALQAGDNHTALKNAADSCSAVSSSYVKNVTVKFEEKMGETASPRCPVRVQKSRNVRILFRLQDRSSTKLPSRSVTRNTDSNTPKRSGKSSDLAGSRNDRLSDRPAVRQVVTASGRPSDALTTGTTDSLNDKKQLSPGAASADAEECWSATDLRQAAGTESSTTRCGHAPCVNRCVGTFNVAMNSDVHVVTGSSVGSG